VDARATRRRRLPLAAALALAALALLLAGCGGGVKRGDDGLAQSPRSTTPTTPTVPRLPRVPPPSNRRFSPPAIAVTPGSGPKIGATVRARFAVGSGAIAPRGFIPGGIAIGSRAGGCTVPTILARDLAGLEAATKRETPRGRVLPLSPDTILLADCGSAGRWAMITWTQLHDGRTTYWTDELRDAGDRWIGTARNVQPGCRMPRAAAAVWQLDVSVCGAPRRPAPPRPRAQPPVPRALPQLPQGAMRA
jgi:hypothetical protein